MGLGVKIRQRLNEINKSQKYLAERLNISEATVSKYISEERQPKPEIIANIATALYTTTDYLLGTETDDVDFKKLERLIARGKNNLTNEQKLKLLNILYQEEKDDPVK